MVKNGTDGTVYIDGGMAFPGKRPEMVYLEDSSPRVEMCDYAQHDGTASHRDLAELAYDLAAALVARRYELAQKRAAMLRDAHRTEDKESSTT